MVKIHTDRVGFEILFKDWQIPIVKILMGDTYTEANPLRSREAWIYTNDQLPKGRTISRASVIFFMQDLVDDGWLNSRKQTGKGGHHDVYWKKASLGQLIDDLLCELNGKLQGLKEMN